MTALAEPGTSIGPGTTSPRPDRHWRAGRLYLPTFAIAAVAGWLSWQGWTELGPSASRSITAGRYQLAGPVVLAFVAVVFAIEQLRPAQRRPLLARGHVLYLVYLLFCATLVVRLVVLLGTGAATLLARHAHWLVLPRADAVPDWCFGPWRWSASTRWTGSPTCPITRSPGYGGCTPRTTRRKN